MPSPVGKYKFWDSTIMAGLGTSANDFWPALEAELDAWITAISGNASLSGGGVPVKQKGYADSTNANYLGFVVELPHPTNPSVYYASFCTSSTALQQRVAETWTDSGGFGGYGAFSGVNGVKTGTWAATGIDTGIFLAYDTTDGEEFFVAGRWDTGTVSNHDPLALIVRGVQGDWSGTVIDGTSSSMVWYSQVDSQFKTDAISQTALQKMTIFSSETSATPYSIGAGASFISANPRLLTSAASANTGSYFGDAPYSAFATARYGPVVIIG